MQKEILVNQLKASKEYFDRSTRCLGTVRQALNAQRKIRFHYTRADGAQASRTVRPLGGAEPDP